MFLSCYACTSCICSSYSSLSLYASNLSVARLKVPYKFSPFEREKSFGCFDIIPDIPLSLFCILSSKRSSFFIQRNEHFQCFTAMAVAAIARFLCHSFSSLVCCFVIVLRSLPLPLPLPFILLLHTLPSLSFVHPSRKKHDFFHQMSFSSFFLHAPPMYPRRI